MVTWRTSLHPFPEPLQFQVAPNCYAAEWNCHIQYDPRARIRKHTSRTSSSPKLEIGIMVQPNRAAILTNSDCSGQKSLCVSPFNIQEDNIT
jgi:hypothetical protein